MYKHQSNQPRPPLVRAAVLCAISAICAFFQVANANVVTNGDFESGNINGWTLSPGGPYDFVCSTGQVAGAARCITHGGKYVMTFGMAGAQDVLSQTLATQASVDYQVSFWLANDNPLRGLTEEFHAMWNGNALLNLGPGMMNSFAYGLNTFTVTGTGNDTLSFVARHDPSQWFLDDVMVSAVPEPTSLALVGLALAGLMFSTRRKNA